MVVCVDEETVSGLLELEESGVGLELKVEDSVVTVEEAEVVPSAVEDIEDDVEYSVVDCVVDGVEGVKGVEEGAEDVEDGVERFMKAAKYPLRNCNGSCDCC